MVNNTKMNKNGQVRKGERELEGRVLWPGRLPVQEAPPVQGGSPCTGRVCLHREILTALRESLYTETIPVHEESPCTVCRETHPVQGGSPCTGRVCLYREILNAQGESLCIETHLGSE